MCKKESQTLQPFIKNFGPDRYEKTLGVFSDWACRLFDRWFDVALCRCGYKSSGRKGTASECLQSASGRHDVRRGWRVGKWLST